MASREVHGTMLVTDWTENDLLLFFDGMPSAPRFRALRNEAWIAKMRQEIEAFDWELEKIVRDYKATVR